MTLSIRDNGFVILDEKKIPEELAHEINHFNGLMKTFNQTSKQKAAIAVSENKIKKLLRKNKGLYPAHIAYGHVPLIKLINSKKSNLSELMQKLEMLRLEFGEEYFKKSLLFEPLLTLNFPIAGINTFEADGPHMNIFMLAVKSGNVNLVESILELVDDVQFKKDMIQQCLQCWTDEHKLRLIPILDLAFDSKSVELLDFLLSTMDELGILSDAAVNYSGFVSTKEDNTNLLKKAVESDNLEIINTILKYRKNLGRAFYVFPASSYPEYIITDMNFIPVFITAILYKSPLIFEKIIGETMLDIDCNRNDNFWSANYKLNTLVSSLAIIDLHQYIQHKDFNPYIFSKILEVKIYLENLINKVAIMKIHFEMETGLPMPRTSEGVDLNAELNRALLWTGTTNTLQLEKKSIYFTLSNILHRLFNDAMLAHNYQAAAATLYHYFVSGDHTELRILINKQDKIFKSILCNSLLFLAVKSQDSNLMEFMTTFKFIPKKEIFSSILEIEDRQSLVFVAKELFHHLHTNKFSISEKDTRMILEKILMIARDNKSDPTLSESINLFKDEMKLYSGNYNQSQFFGKSQKINNIEKMLEDIAQNNVLTSSGKR
jgi:hypothetical protein